MNTTSIVDVRPPTTAYNPSMWGDIFTTISLDDEVQEKYAEEIEALKKEARSILVTADSKKLMILIDTIERLGLAYHFEKEIEWKLQEIYKSTEVDGECDLFTTALQFRLLRQHQYHISCSIFNKYKDNNGKFQKTLASDIEGLLSLYEAVYVQMNGEDILKEAISFATHHLTHMVPHLESPLKDKVKIALERPLHRHVPIVYAHLFMSIYEREDSRNDLLLNLAKLNFKFLQNLYKKELCQLSRWWNEFDLKSKLAYARDRLVEAYLWGAAFHFEPHHSDVRIAVTKSLQLVTIIDDTYDNYATLKEAQLFTQCLERWNKDEVDQLPDYMKIVYHFIMSIYEDYERETTKQGKSFAIPHFREAVKQLGRAYNKEKKWVMERNMPSFEEYTTNSVITSCIFVIFTALIPSLKSFTKESIHWLINQTNLTISTAKIGRYCNDLGSHERESKGGTTLTSIDCYMKQHGVSKREALSKFVEAVEDEWKNVNAEWVMTTTCMHKELMKLLLNYARVTDLTYNNNEDGYTNPENNFTPHILRLFVDPTLI